MLVAIALDRPLADAQAFVGSEIYEFSEAQKALLLLLRTEKKNFPRVWPMSLRGSVLT